MKIGKIVSATGSEIISSLSLTKKPLDLKTARKLYGITVSLDESKSSKAFGRIANVIGRVDEPYVVISPFGRKGDLPFSGRLVNRLVYSRVKLKI
ncbi:MAG: hypothetical protein JW724_02890 [Candidatus Altiarchaeota archaeon]|nr:hypothetical protein [Candidatus Altiarchaeota archaeon]